MKDGVKTALVSLISAIVGSTLNPIVTHCLSKRNDITTIVYHDDAVHVGDEHKDSYPEGLKDWFAKEQTYTQLIPGHPAHGLITVEAADVDLIGAEVFFNGKLLDTLKPGRDWKDNGFYVAKDTFIEGANSIMLRSREWTDKQQTENFLFRKLRLEIKY